MSPLDCLTGHGRSSVWPVWVTFWLFLIVITQYIRIAIRWYSAMRSSVIAVCLICIFLMCAGCGYGMFLVAMKHPNLAYTLQLLMAFALVASNESFLVFSRGKRFEAEAANLEIGARVSEALSGVPESAKAAVIDDVLEAMANKLKHRIGNR